MLEIYFEFNFWQISKKLISDFSKINLKNFIKIFS
jgi:hypothetical protein